MKPIEHTIISVTGTKGKTSLVRMIDHVLGELGESVVRVDTDGAFYNDIRRFSDADSRHIWGYAVTNLPGRFLALHTKFPAVSVLEATLFSAKTGLGYKKHDIGVFTNVYSDHIGAFPDIQTPQDIAAMKSFVFSRLAPDGSAVYNADDELVVEQLSKLPAASKKIAVSLNELPANMAEWSCFFDGNDVVLKVGAEPKLKIKGSSLDWLKPDHTPSRYLALFAVATLSAYLHDDRLEAMVTALQGYKFDEDGGRMIEIPLDNGATVLLDYAHETVSLRQIAEYARTISKSDTVIGVLRLAPSRTDALVRDTARDIYDRYDQFVIYDKVDGHFRKPKTIKGYRAKHEEAGRMANLFGDALKNEGEKPVDVLLREDHAIERAIELSNKGDVIVYIVGDDPARSRQFVASKVKSKETI